jgi:predicted metalloprotease
MQLGDQPGSANVEDRRGMGMAAGGLGVGGVVIALIAYFLGFDPGTVINVVEQTSPQVDSRAAPTGVPADEAGRFVSKVLGSTEKVWGGIFQQSNARYRPPTLVLYDGQVRSACGTAQAAMGPFYCEGDEKLYIDLAFFRELQNRFRSRATSRKRMSLPTRWVITCRNLPGDLTRRMPRHVPKPTAHLYAWNCRLTATRASGASTPAP